MLVQCDKEQHQVLISLVESRIREMHPTIRHSSSYKIHDELKHDLEVLENLLENLHEAQENEAQAS